MKSLRSGLIASLLLALPLTALAGPDTTLDPARDLPLWWWSIPAAATLALLMAWYFYRSIMACSEGTDRMKEIACYVREGAYAYLHRQYKTVIIFFLVVSAVLAFMAFGLEVQHPLVPFAFITGGFFSGLAGFFGMKTATHASARTAQAASESLNQGLTVAFRAGAVMGLTVVGLALLDISLWFLYLYRFHHLLVGGSPMNLETITVVMLCFGMGASSQALFARVGGGIFTKAADVGADLVGKVEAGIPEDDPRNPATIADNVGDNVGDVAGMGADLYESYAGSILATAALGVAAISFGGLPAGYQGDTMSAALITFLSAPMLLAAAGILLSILGIFLVKTREGATMSQLIWALNRGIYGSSILVVGVAAAIVHFLGLPWGIFGAIVTGILVGLIIGKGTEIFTAADYKPTQRIADASRSGTGPLIISGIAEGMMSTWVPIATVGLGMILAFAFCQGTTNMLLGLYGVGFAAVGMLSTLGITLATDAYGPIADNAGGNAEMAQLGPEVRKRTDALDSLGNTTAAIGKGFAIGSAALTALALLAAYMEEVRVGLHREAAVAYQAPAPGQAYAVKALGFGKYGIYLPGNDTADHLTLSAFESQSDHSLILPFEGRDIEIVLNQIGEAVYTLPLHGTPFERLIGDTTGGGLKAGLNDYMDYYNITLINPNVLVGVFLGVMLVFMFSAQTMKAVGRAASAMVQEVRRQFAEFPGIMAGTQKPDYARCVYISTVGAQREMIVPTLMAVTMPVAVGLVLDVAGVMGLLVGGLTSGYAVAVFMANSGGAWDNAKKYIEAGHHGGKGSDPHKAAVVGDTVGDPFKDTSGPSLNILIKLMNMVSIVFAGLIVKYGPQIGSWLNIRP
ncbi:MAG TPA: sodium-translocating pyrophosphatase [Kiritimatiellia bacterium]|nr:sodium-translocating pyrophosphatase [Kiritimatiellia bacterium]